ncbi:hypothetical protein D3C81_2077610 [compost metagenome]
MLHAFAVPAYIRSLSAMKNRQLQAFFLGSQLQLAGSLVHDLLQVHLFQIQCNFALLHLGELKQIVHQMLDAVRLLVDDLQIQLFFFIRLV